MAGLIENFSPKEWEKFCERMLRQHHGAKNFWPVPDTDGGDLGIEFFTSNGTIYQCYYPDKNFDMKKYKEKVKEKINDDLKKLKDNEDKIKKILDDTIIINWVLLIPEFKSKDLIAYCQTKKKEVISNKISYIDNSCFTVKIETADSYPAEKIYAQSVQGKAIDIPIEKVSEENKKIWKSTNSKFLDHIIKKSDILMKEKSSEFQDRVIEKYLQIEKFLEQLRESHPDIHAKVEDTAIAQLDNILDSAYFESNFNSEFIKGVINLNKNAFEKYSENMCDKNLNSLSFGYLSKWLAECNMEFLNGK